MRKIIYNGMKISYKNFLKHLKFEKPLDYEVGDYVVPYQFDDLNPRQLDFLKSKKYFYVDDIIVKDGEKHIEIGYTIPFKARRFKKIEVSFDHRVLFLQFNININTHNEPDTGNFFRGCNNMSELFPIIINEKLPNTLVEFYDFSDVYRLQDGYYIKNVNLKDYEFVFFGNIGRNSQISLLVINYLKKHKVPYLMYGNFSLYDTKSYGLDLTESLGYTYIPTISTVKLNKKIISTIKSEFGFPLIVKKTDVDRGEGVFKINNMKELEDKFTYNNDILMIQKLIPNDGDFRVIVIKNQTRLIIKRQVTSKDEFRSNVALGGKAIKATLPKNITDMCEDISKHVSCDILGFDILQDLKTGEYYVMEINVSPHFPTFCVVSGVNLPDIISEYIVNNLK